MNSRDDRSGFIKAWHFMHMALLTEKPELRETNAVTDIYWSRHYSRAVRPCEPHNWMTLTQPCYRWRYQTCDGAPRRPYQSDPNPATRQQQGGEQEQLELA